MEKFDNHWESRGYRSLPVAKLAASRHFLAPMFAALGSPDGTRMTILDAGCGDGVHAATLAETHHTFSYLGFDISEVAVKLCRGHIKDARHEFIVADAMQVPAMSARFDAAICYGVAAYTEDPARAIQELARVVRPGGILGLWIYPRPSGISGSVLRAVRAACRLGGKSFTLAMANAIIPFMRILPVNSGVHLGNASWAQCREVVMVNIAPSQLHFPQRREVLAWCDAAGLDVEFEDPLTPIALWLRKR